MVEVSRRHLLRGAAALGLAAASRDTISDAHAAPKTLSDEHKGLLQRELFQGPPEWSLDMLHGVDRQPFTEHARAIATRHLPGTGWLRPATERLLAHDAYDMRYILSSARHYKVPKEVVFLALQESRWQPTGENFAYAAGYWQFTPATARAYGLLGVQPQSRGREPIQDMTQLAGDERNNMQRSTDAAMRYLSDLKKIFERHAVKSGIPRHDANEWAFAMWAYNRGPGHVLKTFRACKGDPFAYASTLGDANSARRESIAYVPSILGIAHTVQSWSGVSSAAPQHTPHRPAATPQPTQPPAAPKTVTKPASPPQPVPEPTRPLPSMEKEMPHADLAREPLPLSASEVVSFTVPTARHVLERVAIWISSDKAFVQERMDQIRALNPQIATRAQEDQINRGEPINIPAQEIYVASGDTLTGLAKKYYPGHRLSVGINYICFMNNIKKDASLRSGQRLIVPLSE